MSFWTGFEKRALSPQFARAAALRAAQRAAAVGSNLGHDSAQFMKARGQARRFADYAINKYKVMTQKADDAAKSTFKGLSEKTKPQVMDYQAIQKADLEKRRALKAMGGGTLDYSNKRKPTFTPNVGEVSKPRKPMDMDTWHKINRARNAKILEQERTGIIR